MTARPISCLVKNPVLLSVGYQKTDFKSGCSVVDAKFPSVLKAEEDKPLTVGEIHFKNYYVAFVTIRAKERVSNNIDSDIRWRTVVKDMQLMPQPHFETGSQDYFVIKKKQMQCDLNQIVGLRFILYQPSPVWKEFKIEDITLYKTSSRETIDVPIPGWMLTAAKGDIKEDRLDGDGENVSELARRKIDNISSIDDVSRNLQQLWALSEEVESYQSNHNMGRYDIDGSYEVNLLSYT